jgi:hypothetical protein
MGEMNSEQAGSVAKILKLSKIEYFSNSDRGKTCKSSARFLV